MSPIYSILFATLSSLAYGFRSIFVKYYCSKGYDVYNMAAQHTFLDGLCGSIGFLIWFKLGNSISWAWILKGIASGLIGGVSTMLCIYGVSRG